jgi:hypothetical protein
MKQQVANVKTPGQVQPLQKKVGHAILQVRDVGRRLTLLSVGAWATMFDAANDLTSAGRRLIEQAEQRGERMEVGFVKRFRQLEQKTVGQLRDLQGGMHLDEARTSLDATLTQTQDELADRIQAVLDGMGIPSREQLERLNREIDSLNDKIDSELQRRAVHA